MERIPCFAFFRRGEPDHDSADASAALSRGLHRLLVQLLQAQVGVTLVQLLQTQVGVTLVKLLQLRWVLHWYSCYKLR